jgi:hypothetical protein
MTQQYLVGQFSSLLGELQPAPGEWRATVDALRREVELSPVAGLPELAREAMNVTDMICWTALERGSVSEFCRYVGTAVALREFTANAGLLP